jgi:parvulin-like peptidyl-prolyl isomerase
MLSYLRRKMKTIMVIVAVLFGATMFYGIGYMGVKNVKEGPKKGSIATVNGKEIDHKQFDQVLRNYLSQVKGPLTPEAIMMYQSAALQQIIDQMILLNDAKRHVSVGGGEVDDNIGQIMQANKIKDINVLKSAIAQKGLDYNDFKEMLKNDIILGKMSAKLRGSVTVTADDLREIRARHILIAFKNPGMKDDPEARTKAVELLTRIKQGSDFASLAAKYSDDKGSAVKGGDLGYFTTGTMVPEFEKAVFALKPGEISGIVKTDFGYHIIKLEDSRLRKIKTKGKDMNEEILAEKQDQAVKRWQSDLIQKSKIEINDPLIKANSLLASGRLNDAISSYNEAVMEDPSNPYAHLFLGHAYRMAKNNDLAVVEYGKAADMSGADTGILISVGEAYQTIGKRGFALTSYRKASLIAGDNKDMHKALEKIFDKMGAGSDASNERSELARIAKKEQFEKEIQQKVGQ